MNVARLELCKELYELSGWWDEDDDNYYPSTSSQPKNIPAYSLGYLLRKLPPRTLLNKFSDTFMAALAEPEFYEARADTPEDALAELAIELFKQEILTK